MKEIQELKKLQANLQVFYQKLSNIHWNIKGLEFFEIHEEVDKLRNEVNNFVDEVAEKILMKNNLALGSYNEVLKLSSLNELTSQEFEYEQATKNIINDLNFILIGIEEFEWSKRVQPLIDEVLLTFDKWLWQFSKLIK
ncbi:DNA starvation/stationary phase protection protein [Mycoplasmopsis felis]|uniref:Dps family protein n=1 Tax=Mycoplasmopsis felis TaxID=33923 RepID=UPI002AF6C049|nr:DNA starvation/stationary phase protection protein [Mycoplasmopsis felis]WQQ02802.1 DNA starvation/stationary phase protection protein [Mycoplasmopsis felis]WQQ03117.1 DNA starvation/stationary phase protection protein [Mycoplasmopsis felis]WQQ05255.1 DNA starvation/stationary phase protection protein [Mycoplasmopsis felis]WQQ06479.1 DNA starvation/stationary phase protection protein [Mycoplasmopsis felis]WQQ06977.1 DNA starvation/stationary phase protection protein [Mycoplasmopsis felis]